MPGLSLVSKMLHRLETVCSRRSREGGRLLTTLAYGDVRMEGQIEIQKYGFIKTVSPKF